MTHSHHFGRNRQPAISLTGKQKLTPLDVAHIRMWRRMGYGLETIARAYGISVSYTSQLCTGQVRGARRQPPPVACGELQSDGSVRIPISGECS